MTIVMVVLDEYEYFTRAEQIEVAEHVTAMWIEFLTKLKTAQCEENHG